MLFEMFRKVVRNLIYFKLKKNKTKSIIICYMFNYNKKNLEKIKINLMFKSKDH